MANIEIKPSNKALLTMSLEDIKVYALNLAAKIEKGNNVDNHDLTYVYNLICTDRIKDKYIDCYSCRIAAGIEIQNEINKQP